MRKMWMSWGIAVIAVIAAAVPVAAQSDLDRKIDSNRRLAARDLQTYSRKSGISTQEKATSELIAGRPDGSWATK